MASLMHSESRRLYSWWWDSHISPKNSKWLQENLTDMDTKVKSMIKLINEDADSFARRAEMYYKKRPELMKLVEEFYRAYRALAERYDHATVELRHAHKTMAEAFPNQVPYVLADDSPSGSSGPEPEPTPEMPHSISLLLEPDGLPKDAFGGSSTNLHAMKRNAGYADGPDPGIRQRGLKELNEMFRSAPQNSNIEGGMENGLNFNQMLADRESSHKGSLQLSSKNEDMRTQETECVNKAKTEVQLLKKILAEIRAEKEDVLVQYQQSLKKLDSLERELNLAQKDAGGLDDRASKAEIEIKILKEALNKLKAERDTGLLQYNQCLEKISSLEAMFLQSQKDAKGFNERAAKAEIEAKNLKQELSRLETEKEAGLLRYNQCLEMISALENKISSAEDNARMLDQQTETAETEVQALKQALAKMKEEKDAALLRYEQCLETLAKMESEISNAQEDAERLNSKVRAGVAKLKSVEEQRALLERSNQSLLAEADNLAKKITIKDQELLAKQSELGKLQNLLKDEHSRFVHVEATLQSLQKLQSQSQEEQRALTSELESRLQMLKNLELCNHGLEEDIQRVKEENQSLNELKNSSTISIQNLQSEICSLKHLKEKLEEEVALQIDQSNALQQEVYRLTEEIKSLNGRYQALLEQLQSVGLNPESLESSVKELLHENSKLKEACIKQNDETEALYQKLGDMDNILGKNAVLESTLSELSYKLEGSQEKVKELQESSQSLQGDKSTLVAEKAVLLSQLQIMTDNMQKLLEKNIILENSLSSAKIELEGLRVKSKSLEEFCQMLKDEKSNLINERVALVYQLGSVEERLGNLEKRFTKLEEKYADMEKEKESTLFQVTELRGFLDVEQRERTCYVDSSESRLVELENHVNRLHEEGKLRKKEFEEELDKAVKAQVEILVLQKFIEDLESKNVSLLVECQKHVEASKLSDKLISELETENLEQQVEIEFLLDEVEKLRMGIYQVFRALQVDSFYVNEQKTEIDRISFPHILDNIEDLKSSILRNEDELLELLIENSVLLTSLGQFRLEGVELESEKEVVEQELEIMTERQAIMQTEKHELLKMNTQLMLELSKGKKQEEALKLELENEHIKLVNLQGTCETRQKENSNVLDESRILLNKFLLLEEEKRTLEEESCVVIQEAAAVGTLSVVLQSFGIEKAEEVKALTEELSVLHKINGDLRMKVELLEEKLKMTEAQNLQLSETVEKSNQQLHEFKDLNDQVSYQLVLGKDFLNQKVRELSEAGEELRAEQDLNNEMCRSIEELKREYEELKLARENVEKQILELSADRTKQKNEIDCLLELNENLESEVGILREEIKERRIRENNLSSELQERSNEFELWENEAASFYFDLQVSAIREVLIENKVLELTGVCKGLEDESVTKSVEIEQMKEKVGSLETEIGGLKVQLSAFVPIVASLKDNIASLENNVLPRTKLCVTGNQVQKGVEVAGELCETSCQEREEVQSTTVTDGISDLKEMQTRVKAVEKAVVEEMDRLKKQETLNTRFKQEASTKEAEKYKSRRHSHQEKDICKEDMELGKELTINLKPRRTKPEITEVKNGILMKDIPLDQVTDHSFHARSQRAHHSDQMLELWEFSEQDCILDPVVTDPKRRSISSPVDSAMVQRNRHPSELQFERELSVDKIEVSSSVKEDNQEGNRGKILERLTSDAQKLTSLQTTIRDLKKKMETNVRRGKEGNDHEYERVKGQLQEVEETLVQLMGINDQLAIDIQKSPSTLHGKTSGELKETGNTHKKRVTEQARKGSEKIGRLQFEVQSIQYILLKLEDEKKVKAKNRFSGGKTGIILRNFIYRRGSTRRRKKKGGFCGCMRPSTNGD